MTATQAALELARKLKSLSEPRMREHVFCEFLQRTERFEAVRVMDEIYTIGRRGGPPFDIALLAITGVLSRELLDYETLTGLYTAAKEERLDTLVQLFFTSRSANRSHAPKDETLEQTLGHRKWKARSPDRNVLERLLRNPEPPVVHELLMNPRLTERDVIALAARRPAVAEVQREIFKSRKWIARPSIKRTLILNPYTPGDMGIRLLGFLNRQDLRLVKTSPNLSRSLRHAAEQLLDRSATGDRSPADVPGGAEGSDEE